MQGSKEAERRPGDGQVCCSLTPGHGSGTGEEGEGAERESLLWGDDIDGTFIPPDLYTDAFSFQGDNFKRWVSVAVIKVE